MWPLVRCLPHRTDDTTNIWFLEIDEEHTAKISKEELQSLQSRSARVDELTKENGRLLKELEEQQAATLHIEELERENTRLSEALEKSRKDKVQETTATSKPRGHTRNVSVPIPTSSGMSTEKKMEGEGDRVVKYNKLVEKFNDLYKTKNYAVEAKNDLVEKQRQKEKKYTTRLEELGQAIARKDARIQKQKSLLTDYRNRLGYLDLSKQANKVISGITSDAETEAPTSPKEPAQPDDAPQQSAAPQTEKQQKENPAIEGSSKSPNGPIVNQNEFPTPYEAPDPTYYPSPTGVPSSLPPASPELPPNLLREGRFHVEDTQFEPMEPVEAEHFSSTQDDPSQHSSPQRPRVETPETPDSPVVISSRTIRKRKRGQDNADQSTPKAVKVEAILSSPILANVRQLTHTDNFDLDEIGEKVSTPKKRRMLELSRKASRLSAASQTNDSPLGEHGLQNWTNSPLSQLVAGVEQPEEVEAGSPLQPLDPNRLLLPRTSNLDPKSPKRRRVISDKSVAFLGEDEFMSDSSGNRVQKTSKSDGRLDNILTNPSPPKRNLRVNQPVDLRTPNQQKVPQLSNIELPSELAKTRQHNLGQSKEVRNSLEPSSISSRNPSPKRPSSSGRMIGRLTQPSRGRDATPATAPRPARLQNSEAPARSVESAPRPRMRRTDNLRPQSRQQRLSREDDHEEPGDHGPEPLRSRPIDKLEKGDFVINVNQNQGLNYAFNDVVRGKEKRRCLQGCTKPECCGTALRTFVLMTNDNRGTPTMSQGEADDKLLADFLGDNAYRIQNMSKDERDEVLLQAKTRDLANTSGKHRYVHERRKSPPGFWQTDFPSTQEHREQLEASRLEEREEVEKRYQQAMRPGGMWKFRDEV